MQQQIPRHDTKGVLHVSLETFEQMMEQLGCDWITTGYRTSFKESDIVKVSEVPITFERINPVIKSPNIRGEE